MSGGDADEALVESLARCTINPSEIQKSQIRHRLNILNNFFFPPPDDALLSLSGSTVLEIGCGQGDMTVVLAHSVGPSGSVLALDPAPLTYGSPYTLGQAQEAISKSHLERTIQWIQEDPLNYLSQHNIHGVNYIVLAHSLFYLPSQQYFGDLLKGLHQAAQRSHGSSGKMPTLLIAEWGMRASSPSAEAHVLAVKAQLTQPRSDGNVRTVLEPSKVRKMASEVGWTCVREDWVATPPVDDGAWEIGMAKQWLEQENLNEQARALITAMNLKLDQHKSIKSMDVWTAVFRLSAGSNGEAHPH